MQLNLDPGFDADLEIAHRALDRGWISREAIETAILALERTPGSRLLNHLPLTPDQRRRLESPDIGGMPDEIVEAAADPSRRVDQYVIGEHLQSGGMGRICKAWDVKLSRWVALKFLRSVGDERSEAYFEREARLAARLSHPNIATIYGSGQAGGERYIAMQFIPGRTLDSWRRGEPGRIAVLLRDAARAVAYANGRGIVHRDLKPSNVMVTPEGRVYVLDFGLARPVAPDARHSATGKAMGTPAYMSPEQARGAAVDARSDVYGLGATLYECLAGRPPFTGATIYDVLRRVEDDPPPKPRRLNPGVPPDLETIVLKCLEKDPARRYATADALADDLDRYLNHDVITARPSGVIYRATKLLAKRKALTMASVASVVLAAVLGWWLFVGGPQAAQLRVESEHLLLRESAMKLWAEARGLAMAGVDPDGIRRRAKVAREGFERAIEKREDAQTLVMKARCLELEGRFSDSMTVLERALALDPRHAEARVELAKGGLWSYRDSRGLPAVLREIDDQGSGEELRFVDLPPESGDARRLRERSEALLAGVQPSPAQRDLLNGLLFMGEGDHLRAAEALTSYTKAEPWDAQSFGLEGLCRYYAKDFKRAMAAFDKALRRIPGPKTLQWRGLARIEAGLVDEAIADYTQAIELSPSNAALYCSRGIAKDRKGLLDEAIADFTKAIELDPNFAVAYSNRGIDKALKGLLDDSIADFSKSIELAPGNVWGYVHRGKAKAAMGRFESALADFAKAIEVNPREADAHFNVGILKQDGGSLDEAIESYSRAIALRPGYAAAYVNRGLARRSKGRVDDALLDFNKAIELNPRFPAAYTNRGLARHAQGSYESAIADHTKAIELDPRLPESYANRAISKQAMGREEEAIADFEKALEVAPQGWPHRASVRARIGDRVAGRLFREGSRLFEQKEYRGAIEKFSEVVTAWSSSQQALPSAYNIACGFALLGEKSSALDWLEKTVDLGWKDVAHLERDPDLESLRKEERFQRLLARLKEQ